MTTYGITSTGPVIKRLSDIKAEYEAAYKTSFGSSFDVTTSSPEGQIIGIESERESLLWELFEDLYYAGYPDTAFGVSLDNVNAINAVLRLLAAKSTVVGQGLFGDIGTIIPQGTVISVSGDSLSRYLTTTTVTLTTGVDAQQKIVFNAVPDAGAFTIQSGISDEVTASIAYSASAATIETELNALTDYSDIVVSGNFTTGFTIDFSGADGKQPQPLLIIDTNTLTISSVAVTGTITTETTGSFQGVTNMIAEATGTSYVANARTLNVIENPITGFTRTYNPNDSVAGRAIETDAAYRLRRRQNLVTAKSGPLDAIRSSLLALNSDTTLPELTVTIFENITLVTDIRGIPGKAFEAFVYQAGGATSRDQEIAETIWSSKPAGIEAHGDIIKSVLDSQGFSHDVGFSRPTEVNIYCDLILTKNSLYPSDGDAQVLAALLEWGNSLGVGISVITYGSNALANQFDLIPGITGLVIKVAKTPSPTGSANIIIDDGTSGAVELSRWDSSRINIT